MSSSNFCSEELNLENDIDFVTPLYVDSRISVSGATCSIMHYCMAYKLSYTAIGELLKLLQLLCPSPNHLPASVYQLKKYFRQCQMPHKCYNICSNCQAIKEECICDHQLLNSHLVHVPIKKQLYSVIKSKTVCGCMCVHLRACVRVCICCVFMFVCACLCV